MDPDEINATLTSTGIGNTLSGSSSDLDLARSGANVSGAVPSCVYSGADIKLVAHLPPPTEEQRDDQIEQAEQELERIREQIGQAPPIRDTDAVTDAVDQTLDETGTTSSEARSLRDQIGAASLEATLWPEGSAERTAAEAQVAELQEQLDALPNEGRASNLSELMQRETELVRLLESLNAERTTPPAAVTKILAEITTLSVSTHREKYQVRTLGSVYPRSVTRGPRCLPATEKVLIKDRGYISIADVVPGDYVQSSCSTYDEVLGSFIQGSKPCHHLKLENGYELTASFDHPISTPKGWVKTEDLKKGDLVHIVGTSPANDVDFPIQDEILKLIAYLIGDGALHSYGREDGSKAYHCNLSIADKEMSSIGQEVEECLATINVGFTDHRKGANECIDRFINICQVGKGATDYRQRVYSELHQWLSKLGLYDKYSHEKFIPPSFISGLSKRQIALFLHRLFATDGNYSISGGLKYIEARYDSTSERLIDEIRVLLSKLGIRAIKNKDHKLAGSVGGRPNIISRYNAHRLVISSAPDLVKFIKRVGIYGKDYLVLDYVPLLISRINSRSMPWNCQEFSAMVTEACSRVGISARQIRTKYNLYCYRRPITPRKALAVAKRIGDPLLLNTIETEAKRVLLEDQDLVALKVIKNDLVGELPVYDLEVKDRHCFIANFFRVHNTISGSVVFTTFYTHVFNEFLEQTSVRSTGVGDWDRFRWTSYITDQMPPLDISIVFANEYGNISYMSLLGVEFMNEGMVMSIEDLFVEGTAQYIARDIELIRQVGRRDLTINRGVGQSLTGTSILMDDIRRRSTGRRNPFL